MDFFLYLKDTLAHIIILQNDLSSVRCSTSHSAGQDASSSPVSGYTATSSQSCGCILCCPPTGICIVGRRHDEHHHMGGGVARCLHVASAHPHGVPHGGDSLLHGHRCPRSMHDQCVKRNWAQLCGGLASYDCPIHNGPSTRTAVGRAPFVSTICVGGEVSANFTPPTPSVITAGGSTRRPPQRPAVFIPLLDRTGSGYCGARSSGRCVVSTLEQKQPYAVRRFTWATAATRGEDDGRMAGPVVSHCQGPTACCETKEGRCWERRRCIPGPDGGGDH
jgi:hypothetical protein